MVIVVFEVCGNWRICSLNAAIEPTSRMSRLTTLASTGRRMKRSVKEFMLSPLLSSLPRRLGGGRQGRAIVEHDRHVGLQLDLAGRHHFLARLHALGDSDALAANRPEPDE